jgi:hypothetical protein
MLNPTHVRELIIEPALLSLNLRSEAAVELVLGTAIQESSLTFLRQLEDGPAIGLFQMEPATHDDLYKNFIAYRADRFMPALQATERHAGIGAAGRMAGNLWYAAMMCRLHYFRVPDALPAAGDIEAQAAMWKKVYNTHLGAGTEEEYLENWFSVMGD